MTLWLAVTPDQYELPLAVADTAVELSRILGITINSFYSMYSHHRSGRYTDWKNYKIIKLDVNDNE